MDLGLRGRVAVVFGASEGLGYGCARALAAEGARVVVSARREAALREAAVRLARETGTEVVPWPGDVSRPGDAARVIDAAAHQFGGGLDVLVNNGGGPPPGATEAFTDEDWTKAFHLLLLSNVHACRAALPHLRKRGGAIVNIVSTSVKQPLDNLVLSNSLRSAVVGLAKTLSVEWAPHGIRVNNVCPGSMQTQRIDDVLAHRAQRESVPLDEVRARQMRAIPLGRFGTPEELGAVVAFLASPRAGYVTGQTLSVDGGATRWIHG